MVGAKRVRITFHSGHIGYIDLEDFDRVKEYWWTVRTTSRAKYAFRNYVCEVTGKARLQLLHRFILDLPHKNGVSVDHVDRNGLNNCRSNLRVCTQAENSRNHGKFKQGECTSSYTGVSWSKVQNLWHAYIWKDYKRIHLGYFENEEDAAYAYDAAAREMFGEFANPNFKREKKVVKVGSVCPHGQFKRRNAMFASKCSECYSVRAAYYNEQVRQRSQLKG